MPETRRNRAKCRQTTPLERMTMIGLLAARSVFSKLWADQPALQKKALNDIDTEIRKRRKVDAKRDEHCRICGEKELHRNHVNESSPYWHAFVSDFQWLRRG